MTDRRFYVYALCDPRAPGSFKYEIVLGEFVDFACEPFYIGKGTGRRMFTHVVAANRGTKQASENPHKTNKILAIQAQGFAVAEIKIRDDLTESAALELEEFLVEKIGRVTEGGLLCNILNGGAAGSSGIPLKQEHRDKLSASHKGSQRAYRASVENMKKAHQLTPDQVRAKAEKQKKTFAARSAEDESQRRAVISNASKRLWVSRTEEQRKDVIARAQAVRAQNKDLPQKTAKILSDRNKVRASCPHCGKEGQRIAMLRFHFDNCKTVMEA
jgi:hypothetical protein